MALLAINWSGGEEVLRYCQTPPNPSNKCRRLYPLLPVNVQTNQPFGRYLSPKIWCITSDIQPQEPFDIELFAIVTGPTTASTGTHWLLGLCTLCGARI
jgi:hypothetical protein